MTRRIMATATTLAVAIATVLTALSFANPASGQQAAPPQGAAKVEVKVVQSAPARKPEAIVKKPAAPAPKPAAAMKVAMPAVAFNAGGQIQQNIQQFRPILRAEYHIVRVVCRLTPEQREEIARDGEKALRDAARKYVEMMNRPMTAAQRAAADPRRQIREALGKVVASRLSGDMHERYRAEIARRDASRKQLAVRNLVARLDRELVLSPEQRDKIAGSLTSHWEDSWLQSIEMFMYDYQFLPPIPDQFVAPFLNDPQKTIWRSIQKVYGFWGGFGMMGGIMVDDPLEDDELRVARLEAAKDDPKPDPNQPVMRRGAVMIQAAPPAAVMEVRTTTRAAAKKAAAAPKEPKRPDSTTEKAVPKQ